MHLLLYVWYVLVNIRAARYVSCICSTCIAQFPLCGVIIYVAHMVYVLLWHVLFDMLYMLIIVCAS